MSTSATSARKKRRVNFLIDSVLFVFTVFMITPLVLLISNGFKQPEELLA